MKIPNTYGNITMLTNSEIGKSSYVPPEKKLETNETFGSDKIEISSKGSFQQKLNQEIKKYSETYKAEQPNVSERVAQLKQVYAGECCPVSGFEIADRVLNKLYSL